MIKTFRFASEALRKLLRRLVGGWSLERKSLLFLGVALVVPIGLAFWFVLAVVADGLVMQTTRQVARDYAGQVVTWTHFVKPIDGISSSVYPGAAHFMPDVFKLLRDDLVDNPDYHHQYLMLDETAQHAFLDNAETPTTDRERAHLVDLEREFRAYLAQRESTRQRARIDSGALNTSQASANESATQEQSQANSLDSISVENGKPREDPLNSEKAFFYRDDGPVYPSSQDRASYADATPEGGWYVYYHAVMFESGCMECHSRFESSTADSIPFRVVKVLSPYKQKQVASTATLAVMISIGMVTVSVTLLVVHWVLRRLVLMPLKHLKSVSDEISRGNTNLRANIDTGDEFNELADAFNRMLRHLTESQEKLQGLNQELDFRVDQLAQANLNLFEANRLKSDFLANMSHELRTPLNSIIGFSDVLRDIPSLSEKQRRYASNIQGSGKMLLEMINDILDLAKVEAGKMTVTPTSFDLKNLVSAQCDMLRSLVDEKNMDLQLEVDDGLPEVFQDQPKLQQILTNLLSNAIKFTPDGGLITVSLGRASDKHFHVTVADTGVGIPESDFEFIFEKFRQSNEVLKNGGLTRKFSGTGLGLSIVKELCKLLGGEIRVSSQLGTGSKFQVILPTLYEQPKTTELSPTSS